MPPYDKDALEEMLREQMSTAESLVVKLVRVSRFGLGRVFLAGYPSVVGIGDSVIRNVRLE